MRILKETIELRADSEQEAKELIEEYRTNASIKGYTLSYTLSPAGYTYKTKKSKGEIIDEAYVCKFVLIYGDVWEV